MDIRTPKKTLSYTQLPVEQNGNKVKPTGADFRISTLKMLRDDSRPQSGDAIRGRPDARNTRPLSLAKAEKKGRTKKEVADRVILKTNLRLVRVLATDMCARHAQRNPGFAFITHFAVAACRGAYHRAAHASPL
jgi:hypothetical protein